VRTGGIFFTCQVLLTDTRVLDDRGLPRGLNPASDSMTVQIDR
jgi:hypothetical protein